MFTGGEEDMLDLIMKSVGSLELETEGRPHLCLLFPTKIHRGAKGQKLIINTVPSDLSTSMVPFN